MVSNFPKNFVKFLSPIKQIPVESFFLAVMRSYSSAILRTSFLFKSPIEIKRLLIALLIIDLRNKFDLYYYLHHDIIHHLSF